MINKFKKPILVTQSSMPPIDKFKKEIENIWDSKWLTNMGQYHEKFKVELRKYLKIKNVELFVNGHLALDLGIKALGLTGEVITTPFTFTSTTHAIVLNGLKPIFCDIDKDDFNIDVNKIEELITDKTSAIIPVHVYGYPCDLIKIEELAQKYNLKVIYDAAHSFGVEVNGKGIGEYGDVSMFSCHATKVFNSIEGGILTVADEKLLRKLYLLKNFGISGPGKVDLIGINAKMNEFQALMGCLNIELIDSNIEKRSEITRVYRELLGKIEGIVFYEEKENIKYNYSYFPIIIDENKFGKTRDQLHDKLEEHNVYTRKYFYPLVTDLECYKNDYDSSNTPIAKYLSQRVLTLPIYSDLAIKDAIEICKIIEEISKI